MSKKTVINEIMDIYEENERLKQRIDRLIEKYESESSDAAKEARQRISEYKLNETAKKVLFKEVFCEWCAPGVGDKECTAFDSLPFYQWEEQIGRNTFKYGGEGTQRMLDEVPLTDIKKYFIEQLEEYYTKKVNEKKIEQAKENKDE